MKLIFEEKLEHSFALEFALIFNSISLQSFIPNLNLKNISNNLFKLKEPIETLNQNSISKDTLIIVQNSNKNNKYISKIRDLITLWMHNHPSIYFLLTICKRFLSRGKEKKFEEGKNKIEKI